jgi:hypothetical protein
VKLENFELESSITLQSDDGLLWDLHNCAYFEGLELIQNENAMAMRWSVLAAHPWGGRNEFAGVELHFKNLLFLRIGPRDVEMPVTEDKCVAGILKVDPAIKHKEPCMRGRREWKATDLFRLAFEFQSARIIEIESESVELRSLTVINDA